MTPTLFFLVMLFATGPDTWALRGSEMPVPFKDLQTCMNAGTFKMVDRRNKKVSLHCIEADDEEDLAKIMRENFNFGGDPI